MGPRILAFVAALAMVVGAVAVRNRMDRSDEERSQVLRLVCGTELRAVCERLRDDPDSSIEVTIEEAGATADRLTGVGSGADPGIDGWLAVGDWHGVVDAQRAASNLDPLFSTSKAVGSTRLAAVVWKNRLPGFAACNRTWACLGDVAARGESGRQVKVSLPNPVTSSTGLAALGAVAASSFGNSGFGRSEIESDPDFQRRLLGLQRASASVETSLDVVLAVGPSAADAIVTTEVALTAAGDIPRLSETDVIYPASVTAVQILLGTAEGTEGRRLQTLVPRLASDPIREGGWTVPPTAETGLPDGGVLAALRESWSTR